MLEVLYVDLLAKENKQVPKLKMNKRSAAFVNKFKKRLNTKFILVFFVVVFFCECGVAIVENSTCVARQF